jgi:hypothetical protein
MSSHNAGDTGTLREPRRSNRKLYLFFTVSLPKIVFVKVKFTQTVFPVLDVRVVFIIRM